MVFCFRPKPAFSLALLAALVGCSTLPISTGTRGARVVDAARIQQSGASNAWDAMRLTLNGIRFYEDKNGQPSRMEYRGASSMLLADLPSIFIDGIRISDFRRLHGMPAAEIATIRFLTAVDGTTRYGTNSSDGVILIRTKGSIVSD